MVFIPRQEPFICEHCGTAVEPIMQGSCRNHCPHCLCSKHVDDQGPGDRASLCGGLMEPVAVDHSGKKGWSVIHRCQTCGKQMPNLCAPDDDLTVLSKLRPEH